MYLKQKTLKNKVITPQKVNKIAKELGLVDKIDVVKTKSFSSFCYGFVKPRICLSLKLAKALNGRELKAVFIHETYHLKNRDPLKILLSQAATSMFFFVPTLRDIHNYYTHYQRDFANWWQYGPNMPIVPILKVGLTPMIQLGILGYFSLKLSNPHNCQM